MASDLVLSEILILAIFFHHFSAVAADVEASADPEARMHRERAEIFRFSLLLHLKKLQRDAKKLLMFREWKAAVNATEQVPQRVQARKPASIAAAEV